MAVLKCKMCGGPIRVIGGRIGECEDCGTKVLLPLIDEEWILNLYNRGNHFRDVGEYDRAYSAYESIVAENRDDAEAHWCLLLCRYGINYVKDERNGEFRPTISRMNRSPILEDPDYKAAIRCSEGEIKDQYIKEAKKLYELQNRFLEIMKKEKPYDVFICFKAEEADRKRTEASRIGQDIYEELTAKGLRVFFSRITLEDKIGEEFEPYIFSALYTAKVMLVVADKKEQLQARWVKNEWIRFLALMDEGRGRAMLPVFYKMDPYDFPPEIPMVQGQDMSQLGAMQNLVNNVLNLCGKAKEKIRLTSSEHKVVNVDNLLRRVEIMIEDGEFTEAIDRLTQIINEDENNGDAWYYVMLAENHAANIDALLKIGCHWYETENFCLAKKGASERIREKLSELEAACRLEQHYQGALSLMKKKKYEEALKLFREIPDYRASDAKIKECEAQLNRAVQIQIYRKEIGKRSEYAERVRKDRYPKETAKYEQLKEKARKAEPPADWLDFGYKPLLIAIAAWVLYVVCLRQMDSQGIEYGYISASVIFIFALVLGGSIFVGVLFSSFWVGAICFGVVVFILTKLPVSLLAVVGVISAVVGTVVCVYATVKSVGSEKADNAVSLYYKNIIEPLEREILREVDRKWEPIIGKENL